MPFAKKKKKEKRNNAICSNMDGSRNYYTKCDKLDKDKYYIITHMWNLKYGKNEHIYKTETDS